MNKSITKPEKCKLTEEKQFYKQIYSSTQMLYYRIDKAARTRWLKRSTFGSAKGSAEHSRVNQTYFK